MKRIAFALALGLAALAPITLVHAANSHLTKGGKFNGTDPAIESIKGLNVKVRVPAGFDSVSLQVFNWAPKRIAGTKGAPQKTWSTVSVQYPRGAATTLTFKLQRLTPPRYVRVFGNTNPNVPASFLTGPSSFPADPPTGDITASTQNVGSGTGSLNYASAAVVSGSELRITGDSSSTGRDVAEADIWKLDGDQLYFFNQLRGLQVFNVKDAADPVLTGTLRMPGVGEDLYTLRTGEVVLLKRATNWLWNDWYWWGSGPIFVTRGAPILTLNQTNIAPLIADSGNLTVGNNLVATLTNTSGAGQFTGSSLLNAGSGSAISSGSISVNSPRIQNVNVGSLLSGSSNESYGNSIPQLIKTGAGTASFESAVISLKAVGSASLKLTDNLLAAQSASLFIRPQIDASRSNELLVTDAKHGDPKILARVSFDGTIRESRLVGDLLYVASQVYRDGGGNLLPRWGCEVVSFDLSNPKNPVKRDSVFVGGYATAVTATDRFLFVADGNGGVKIVDISAPNGTMKLAGFAPVLGSVDSKFKMHLNGDTLSVVSSFWGYADANGNTTDQWTPTGRWRLTARLANFSLADPTNPVQLGVVEFAEGETLRATRFEGDRAYVVTFRQIDPLWIIDLKNPSAPTITGHVQVPGFSTYIEPLGDRLVTIGLVNWEPSVSLFDVSDSANPKVLKQLELTDSGWSSSEAVWNEKAFNVIPEENLILLPLQSYDWSGGQKGSVQIIDLLPDTLEKRGAVASDFSPRRSMLHGKEILALSPTKLVSVNAADRDHPVVQAEVEIAWSVNRVFAVGEFLVQLGASNAQPTITVSPVGNPDHSLWSIDLPQRDPIVGATVRDGVLYIVQSQQPIYDSNGNLKSVKPGEELLLSTYSVASLPKLPALGSTHAPYARTWSWGPGEMKPLWPAPGTLVWSVAGESTSWWEPMWYDPAPYLTTQWTWHPGSYDGTSSTDGYYTSNEVTVDPPGYWTTQWFAAQPQRLIAFDVRVPRSPVYTATVDLGKDKPWEVAPPLAAEGLIFASHKDLGAMKSWDDYQAFWARGNPPPSAGSSSSTTKGRHFLQTVDFTDPAAPVVRQDQPNLPGRLVGISRKGSVLYTIGQEIDDAGVAKPSTLALQASALNGSGVHLIDTLPLAWEGQPFALAGETILLLKPEPTRLWTLNTNTYNVNSTNSKLESWTLSDAGKFEKLDEIELNHESNFSLFGNLVVAHGGGSYGSVFLCWRPIPWFGGSSLELNFVDVSQPRNLRVLGDYNFEGTIYPDLSHADGDERRGLWIPLGQYGVEVVARPASE